MMMLLNLFVCALMGAVACAFFGSIALFFFGWYYMFTYSAFIGLLMVIGAPFLIMFSVYVLAILSACLIAISWRD